MAYLLQKPEGSPNNFNIKPVINVGDNFKVCQKTNKISKAFQIDHTSN